MGFVCHKHHKKNKKVVTCQEICDIIEVVYKQTSSFLLGFEYGLQISKFFQKDDTQKKEYYKLFVTKNYKDNKKG